MKNLLIIGKNYEKICTDELFYDCDNKKQQTISA